VWHRLARRKVNGVAHAGARWDGRDTECVRLFWLPVLSVADGRVHCVVCKGARIGHWLAGRKFDGVAETLGSRNGVDVEALRFGHGRLGSGRHGESSRYRLVGLCLLLLRDGTGKRGSGGLRCGRRERADGLVDNVVGLQHIVDYAMAVVLFARALVNDPIAIDNKLQNVLAGSARDSRS
jgi:hypothetical protein